ncbi:glyceraldehyde-3-phosphate dehydrogenase [Vibrio sp. SS-MA-C1-2]|uniref:glyceraldehyde-3-phosphate dehydrogenase n=1 Tax=Vibrio sp. SS-MA-C1-2 TaxID=2908646 RepID=UPI001F24E295|nr:glyceraldehyde-3-phosphate dehydrogenase [Vibrio sp. SS-MA-C1-2]UJF17323.1 glyceraldehyde-3-phosphate dehydrogenase [Vibrio sp. SS-MA-C1-2]
MQNRHEHSLLHSILISILMLTPILSSANSFTDSIDKQFDIGEYLAENAYGFLPIPIILTEPATGFGGGMLGLFLHESDAQKNKRQKLAESKLGGGAHLLTPALSLIGAYGTNNGTWAVQAGHRRTWHRDHIRYTVNGKYGDTHMSFYPFINSDTLPNDKLKLGNKEWKVNQLLQFRVLDSPLFIGFSQEYYHSQLTIEDNAAYWEEIALQYNYDNYSPNLSALGLFIEYDTLNSYLYPTAGADYTLEYKFYRSGFGSDYTFDLLNLTTINYFSPLENKNWIFGIKGQLASVIDANQLLPPPTYPDINLRGIPKNHYQNQNTSSIEGQVMWKITNRWVVSVFGG